MYTGFVAVGDSPSHVSSTAGKTGFKAVGKLEKQEPCSAPVGPCGNLRQSRPVKPEDTRKI